MIELIVWIHLQHNSCAIHVASQGKKEIVEMLLTAGCNVNAVDDVSYNNSMLTTALHEPHFIQVQVQVPGLTTPYSNEDCRRRGKLV